MRVLFTSTGNTGHLLPLIPLAQAVQREGHEVLIATQRSRGEGVRSRGFPLHAFDDPPEAEASRLMAASARVTIDEANALVVGELFARLDARAALPGLLDAVDAWHPDLIVREAFEYAGGLVAELRDVPQVRVGLGLARTEAWAVDLASPALNKIRAEVGLPGDPGGERLHATPYLTFVPEALEVPGVPIPSATVRCRTPKPSTPAALPELPSDHDRQLVYASFGTMTGRSGYYPRLYRDLIDALATLPVRAIVTTGDSGDLADLGTLPPNVRVERWVEPDAVLPHAAAAISHGGFGTTLGALQHGVPLVMVPLFASDQWHLTGRLAEVGAAIAVPRDPAPGLRTHDVPGPDGLADLPGAVMRAIEDPHHRHASRRLADEIAALPSVDEAVFDLLTRVAHGPEQEPA